MKSQSHLVYHYGEAFCLMQYDSDDGTETEVIWNSRDGVSPFTIPLKSGKVGSHARWEEDVRACENMARALGVRWFVDATRKNLADSAVRWVEKYWDDPEYPMSLRYETEEVAREAMLDAWLEQPGSPTLVDPPEGEIWPRIHISKFPATS